MADALTATVSGGISWKFLDTLDLTVIADASSLTGTISFTDGTATDLADKIWSDTRSLASSANDDLDLNALTNSMFGSTVTINLVKVKAILIVNTNTTAGDDLVIDTSVTHGCTNLTGGAAGKIPIPADSTLLLSAKKSGWACTNGSVDILRITNTGSNTISYKIVIIGTSA